VNNFQNGKRVEFDQYLDFIMLIIS
jgi:hypothetical protein